MYSITIKVYTQFDSEAAVVSMALAASIENAHEKKDRLCNHYLPQSSGVKWTITGPQCHEEDSVWK